MSLRDYYHGARKGVGKTTGFFGKLLSKALFIATLATGIGFVQYVRGGWPFISNPENQYMITQTFYEGKGPALSGPGTKWYLQPFVKVKKTSDGQIETVSGRSQSRDFKDVDFVTKDGIKGKAELQYVFKIPNAKSANRFYWEIGRDTSLIDEKVKGRLTDILNDMTWRDLVGMKGKEAWKPVLSELEYLVDEYGMRITNIEMLDYQLDKGSQKIVLLETEARERANATRIQAQATLAAAQDYLTAGHMYKMYGSRSEVGDLAMRLADLDNNQEVAGEGGTIVKMSGNDNYAGAGPIFVPMGLNDPRRRPNGNEGGART